MDEANVTERMQRVLARQKSAFLSDGPPSVALRRDRIQRAINLLVDYEPALCDALHQDFGHRSRRSSRMADIVPSIRALKYARDNFEAWMADEPRAIAEPFLSLGATGYVKYQPKGVVGNIAPWNAPVNVAFSPLGGIFAAGNRVMVKPSEYNPATARLIEEAVPRYFDESEFAVFNGGPEVAEAFASLAFDHLLFTGSTEVGRHILTASAKHLTPVTLELGGKSPVIIGRSADLPLATDRIVCGKMLNGGQICLSPDYAFAPREMLDDIVIRMSEHVRKSYPTFQQNDDHCAVINERHRSRIDALLSDSLDQGARLIVPEDGASYTAADFKRPLTFVTDVHDQMRVMQEEIFGPAMPIMPYDRIEEAVEFINARPRPLGLYYFGNDEEEEEFVRDNTLSGGMTVNDVMAHVAHEQLPFGGVGPSGMGNYHGFDGFKTFSHARAVYRQSQTDFANMIGTHPPFGEKMDQILEAAIAK